MSRKANQRRVRSGGLKTVKSSGRLVVLAVAAHPDDIEFGMAGTLLLLKRTGAEIHMWNLADGSCGTVRQKPKDITLIRRAEAGVSARVAGATLHPPIGKDLQLFFEPKLLARAAARLRAVKPDILLVPSPQDYMEDHQNACRLAVGAAFVRGMRNFKTSPSTPSWQGETVIYHALPHQLRDGLRRLVRPGQYVDIGPVLEQKKRMLACHRSQREWLDQSQGLGAYVGEMVRASQKVGALSGRFRFAEGWRRHSHLGFSALERDPLSERLKGFCWTDPRYEKSLETGND